MNNVQLIGRLTKDVDLRYVNTANGQMAIARFTVAIDRAPKPDGSNDADFISCQAWGKRAETIQQHFGKGSRIAVTGSIRTGSYQNQQGATVYTTDVEVNGFDFLDPKNTQQPNATAPDYNMQQGQQYYQQAPSGAPVPPSQQAQNGQNGRSRTARSASNTKPATASARPAASASRCAAPTVQDEGGWASVPDGVMDEGLPFN